MFVPREKFPLFSVKPEVFNIEQPLAGCRIKIERAKQHLRDLDREIARFFRENPYVITPYCNLEHREVAYDIHVPRDVPIGWSGIIGDVVHNLRTAFDLLACSLVRFNNRKVGKHNRWPIVDDKKDLSTRVDDCLGGASKPARDLAKDSPSYFTGDASNSPVYCLHVLDLADKHSAVIPTGSGSLGDIMPGVPITHSMPRFKDVFIGLVDGMTILSHSVGSAESDGRARFAFAVVFGEGSIVRGMPVVPTLAGLTHFTEEFVGDFAGKIFKISDW